MRSLSLRVAGCCAAALVLWFVGCTRRVEERTADASLDDEIVAAAHAAVKESEVPASLDDIAWARRLSQLTRQAEHHEHHGYYEHAIAAREALVHQLAERCGAQSWQARSAHIMLERERRYAHLNSVERAKCAAAESQADEARELWREHRPQEALAALDNALSATREVWGSTDYTLADLIEQRARWYDELRDVDQAIQSWEITAQIRQQVFGADHPATVEALSGWGLALQAAGQYAAAESALRQAHARAQQLWGPEQADGAVHARNLALLLHARGNDAEALPLAERAIQLAAERNAPADNELTALVAQLRHSTTNSGEAGASSNTSSDAAREPAVRAQERRPLLRG